ncbi:hypothetical protein HK102_003387, partial [Quaeritorhiza haematococci]
VVEHTMDGFDAAPAEAGGLVGWDSRPSADAGSGWEGAPAPAADAAANWGGGGGTSPLKAAAVAAGGWDSAPSGDAVGASDWALPSGAAAAHNDWEVSGGGGVGGYDAGADDGGYTGRGGGGGARGCFNCGSTDHMSRECTEPRKPREGQACFNCGSTEHVSRECPEPRKPREGQSCFNCGSTDHVSRECPEPRKPKEGQSCFYCASADHFSKNCPQKAADEAPREPAAPEELERLWEAVKKADKMMDIDDIRDAILEYVQNDPNETWPNIERKLRDAGCKTHLIAELKDCPPHKELADIAGVGDKRYEVLFTCSSRNIKKKLKDEAAYDENMKNLVEAGILRNRSKIDGKYVLPEWATGHLTSEQLAVASGGCYRCGMEPPITKGVTVPRRNRSQESANASSVASSDTASGNVRLVTITKALLRAVVAAKLVTRRSTALNPTRVPSLADDADKKAIKPQTAPMKTLAPLSLVGAADRKVTKQWIVLSQIPDLHSLAVDVEEKVIRRWIVRSLTEGALSLAEAVEKKVIKRSIAPILVLADTARGTVGDTEVTGPKTPTTTLVELLGTLILLLLSSITAGTPRRRRRPPAAMAGAPPDGEEVSGDRDY